MFRWVPITLLLLLMPNPVMAQECDGLSIGQVLFTGCIKGACASSGVQRRLVTVTDLLAAPYTPERLDLAVKRLMQSGFFRKVEGSCELDQEGSGTVTFKVVPNRFIRSVDIEGVQVLYKSELKKRLFLRTGTPFNPDQAESSERLERQVSGLLTYIKQQGFDSAAIRAQTVLVGPDQVDIVFYVDEGRVARVATIVVTLEQELPPKELPEYGCPKVSKRVLEGLVKVSQGDVYTGQIKRKAKKNLQFFLQRYGFIAPKVSVAFDETSETLSVNVRLDKCFSILVQERESNQAFGAGYELNQDPAIFRVLPFRESGVFDEAEAERGLDEMLAYYRVRGFLFARVEMQFMDYRLSMGGWSHPLVGGVIYRVTKGPPSEIREMRFEGPQAKESEELEAAIQTRRYDFFDVGGFLDVEQFFADLDAIRTEYHRSGFFQMKYIGTSGDDEMHVTPERHGDTTHWWYSWRDKAFLVIQHDWENAVTVVVKLEEGPSSQFGEVSFTGVFALEEEELLTEMGVKKGMGYSPEVLRRAVAVLESKYRRMGYSPQIEVHCTGYEPEVPMAECVPAQVRSQRVDIGFQVMEGERSLMGEVLVSGNLRTKASIVERDFPSEGKPLNWAKVDEAVRRLRNSGTFSSVKLTPIGSDEKPPRTRLAMAVQVEEATTQFLDFSVGFQTITRLDERVNMAPWARDFMSNSLHYTGSPLSGAASFQTIAFPDVLLMLEASYYDHNFLGLQKSLILPIQYGLSTTDPFRYASFMPTWLDRRLFGSDVTLRFTPLIIYDQALKILDTFEYGGEAEVSYPIWEGVYVSWLNRVSRIQWKYSTEADFGDIELQVKSAPQVRVDWRDSPINPTKGGMGVARLTYLNALDNEANRENYWKVELAGQYFLSLRRTVILGAHVRIGDSVTPSGGTLPENERFRLGGANGIRGFTYGGIGQYTKKGALRLTPLVAEDGTVTYSPAVGGDLVLNGSFEVRFPLLRKTELWGAVFADWGALSDNWDQLNGSSFRFSVGVGIRLLIGGQIPLRLDYGVVLDKRCAQVDATGACQANEDTGALDFGLLYTF